MVIFPGSRRRNGDPEFFAYNSTLKLSMSRWRIMLMAFKVEQCMQTRPTFGGGRIKEMAGYARVWPEQCSQDTGKVDSASQQNDLIDLAHIVASAAKADRLDVPAPECDKSRAELQPDHLTIIIEGKTHLN
ncbi:hypothetical protein CHU98_g12214 [Xylaria longipes]|nr:hypothetical protein CHU98_g12214 [Xylaria longipes]